MCNGANREHGCVQSRVHVLICDTHHSRAWASMHMRSCAAHRPVRSIHAMPCACGRCVYTACIKPQVGTCSMRGPGRTHVHVMELRVHMADLSPHPQGLRWKEGVKGRGGAADARPAIGVQVETPPTSGGPEPARCLGPWPPPTCRAPGAFLVSLATKSSVSCPDQPCIQG